MTHGNAFTEPERQRARELVIYGLIEVFQKARRQYRNSMSIEDTEVSAQPDMPVPLQSRIKTKLTEPAF